jgi:hypothetical protein
LIKVDRERKGGRGDDVVGEGGCVDAVVGGVGGEVVGGCVWGGVGV